MKVVNKVAYRNVQHPCSDWKVLIFFFGRVFFWADLFLPEKESETFWLKLLFLRSIEKKAMVITAQMSLMKLVFSGYEYQESAYFESRLKKVVELC